MWERSRLRGVWPSVEKEDQNNRDWGHKHPDLSVTLPVLLPVPSMDWTQQEPTNAVLPGQPAGVHGRVKKDENGSGGTNGKNPAFPDSKYRKGLKTFFPPQFSLHCNSYMTNLHLLMEKSICHILIPDCIQHSGWKVQLNSLKGLNSPNREDASYLSCRKIPRTDVLHCCCRSVANSCPTLCDPKEGSVPGLPVLHHLLEFAQVQNVLHSLLYMLEC